MRKQPLTTGQQAIYENLRDAIEAVIRLPAADAGAIEAHLQAGSFPHCRPDADDLVLQILHAVDQLDAGEDRNVWDEVCDRIAER